MRTNPSKNSLLARGSVTPKGVMQDMSAMSNTKYNESLMMKRTLNNEQKRLLEQHRAITELKTSYTKSCREIVFK